MKGVVTIARIQIPLSEDRSEKYGNTTASGKGMIDVDANDYAKSRNLIATPTAMQPSTIQAGSQNAMGSPTQQTSDGLMGVRQGLNARGIDNGRIGWNNGYVTIDGQTVFKPNVNIDGTTYADEKTINSLAQSAYRNAGDELVAARQYAGSYLDPSLVQWDGSQGVVNVGGAALKPTFVTPDGIAYIPKSQMDNAIAAYRSRTGYISPSQAYERNNDRFDMDREAALRALTDRKQWSGYNPDRDPVYQAYRAMYERNADDQYRRVLNDNNTSVTGASGAVLAEAIAARNAQMQRLNDAIPTLAQQDYNRYLGENQRLRDVFTDVYRAADNDYERQRQLSDTLYGRGRDAISDQMAYEQAARNAYTQSLNNTALQMSNDAARIQNEYLPGMLDQQLRSAQLTNDAAGVQLSAEKQNYIWDKGARFGFWTVKDADVVPELLELYSVGPDGRLVRSDGSIVNPQDFMLDYAARELAIQNEAAYGKAYNSQLGRQNAKLGL